jgi:hypothetical protein
LLPLPLLLLLLLYNHILRLEAAGRTLGQELCDAWLPLLLVFWCYT